MERLSGDHLNEPTVNDPLVSRRAFAGASAAGSTSTTCRCVIRQSWSTTSNAPNFLSRSFRLSDNGSVIVNAIRRPSGDHSNALTPSSTFVRTLASPPFGEMMYTCRLSERSDTNAIVEPSGDHDGDVLDFFAR